MDWSFPLGTGDGRFRANAASLAFCHGEDWQQHNYGLAGRTAARSKPEGRLVGNIKAANGELGPRQLAGHPVRRDMTCPGGNLGCLPPSLLLFLVAAALIYRGPLQVTMSMPAGRLQS